MAGRYDKPGSQGEWPYPGSGPSGSSDTEAGLARLAALRYVDVSEQGEGDAHEAPAPQAAEGIRADQHREALWSAEETLRNTPEALVAVINELEGLITGGTLPVGAVHRLGSIVECLRGINLHNLDVARQQVGTTAYAMDMETNNRQ